jgi:hypothetical protein
LPLNGEFGGVRESDMARKPAAAGTRGASRRGSWGRIARNRPKRERKTPRYSLLAGAALLMDEIAAIARGKAAGKVGDITTQALGNDDISRHARQWASDCNHDIPYLRP